MKKYNSKVYIHFVPDDTLYVGKTSTELDERWKDGEGYSRQKEFYSKIQEFGWDNIEHVVFKSGLTKEEAAVIERDLTVFLSENESVTGKRVLNVKNNRNINRKYTHSVCSQEENNCFKYDFDECVDEDIEEIVDENARLREYIRKLEKQIDELPYNEAEFRELKAKYDMLQMDYQNLGYIVEMLRAKQAESSSRS